MARAQARPRNRPWTPEEEAILKRYYGPGMIDALVEYYAEHYPPGRSRNAIRSKARALGLQGREGS